MQKDNIRHNYGAVCVSHINIKWAIDVKWVFLQCAIESAKEMKIESLVISIKYYDFMVCDINLFSLRCLHAMGEQTSTVAVHLFDMICYGQYERGPA